jgi:hypothetical protein
MNWKRDRGGDSLSGTTIDTPIDHLLNPFSNSYDFISAIIQPT